nr:hypothetical protein GCM10017611_51540 [Rhodococcus wratislaviensis]
MDFAGTESARQLVLGATRRSRRQELMHGSVINKAIRTAGAVEVHVIPARRPAKHVEPATPPARRIALPVPRRIAAWVLALVAPAAIALGLLPLRPSLGLAGALLCVLIAVVGAALLGGVRPAVLATIVGVVLCDFFYTEPLYSFHVQNLVDVVALITFSVVAVAVGGLIDLLTRQGVQVACANAEAANLSRLAADSMVSAGDLTDLVGAVRRAFDLDAVAVLRRQASGWQVEATAGRTCLEHPDQAQCSVEIARGRVLALGGARLTDRDATLLRVFLDELKISLLQSRGAAERRGWE